MAGAGEPAPQPKSSKEKLRLKLYVALVAADAAALLLSFLLANALYLQEPFHRHGMEMLTLLLPMFLGVATNNRAYSIEVLQTPKKGLRRASQSLVFAVAVTIGTIFYLKAGDEFSRVVMAVGTILSFVSICTFRWVAGHSLGRHYNWRFTNEVLLVDEVAVFPDRGQIVVFADQAQLSPNLNDPMLMDRLGRLLQNCDRVVLACPPSRRAAWAGMLKGVDISVEVLAPELDEMGALGLGRMGDRSTMLVSRGALAMHERILKRGLDLALTVPAIVVLAPVFIAIAIAIKLDSPGPVFFRQPRVGLGNRMFDMIKFRSMRVETLDARASQLTQVGDKRVTRVGDFLRRTSLDELPQLFNVLKGDMSIAGPRPHATGALAGEDLYWEVDQRYWHRHSVKPGITGLAQVRGFRGTTFERSDLSNRLQADLEYLTGWSLWRDLAIVLATVRVLTHRNAF